MLNLTEIASRIKQPELCVAQDVDSLKTLCETYPYSQVFPLLYLKTLAQTNDVRLDNELQRFAYRIADRSVLFELLQNKKIIIEEQIETSFSDVVVAELQVELEEEVIQETTTPPIDAQTLEVEVIDENTNLEVKQTEEEVISSEVEITPIIEVEEKEIPITVDDKTDNLPSLSDELLNSFIPLEIYSLEIEEKKNQEDSKTIENSLEEEKQKLIAALSQKKTINDFSKEEKVEQEMSFTSWLKKSTTVIANEKPSTDKIVTQFIESKPKISSPKEKLFEDRKDKNELFNPTAKAKESLDESQLPVSETLAKIFAAQGNYPKAIYAYQQLMLIFPEKKVFFASQIEDLTKKINI